MRRITPIRLVLVALALVLASLAGPIAPASADHANGALHGVFNPAGGHWGNRYAPPVGFCYINTNQDANVIDGAYYWQDTFFPQGYNPPLPRATYTANAIVGWINSCPVVPNSPMLAGSQGRTYIANQCDTACNHLQYAMVYVANNLDPVRRQQVWRHEMGHAVGLGHTAVQGCVMQDDSNVPLGTRCQHDIDTMHFMYDHVTG